MSSYSQITDWTDVEQALQTLDQNFQYVISEIEEAGAPKEGNVDYNSFTIINLGDPVGENSPVRLKDIDAEYKGDQGDRGSRITAGTTFPAFSASVDGDLFIDTSTGNLFEFDADTPTWGSNIGNLRGPSGDGSGDLVASANLSDVQSPSQSRSNLGLSIGVDVQAFNVALNSIAAINPTVFTSADPGLVVFEGNSSATIIPIDDYIYTFLTSANADEAATNVGFSDIVFKSVGSSDGQVPEVGSDFFKKSNISQPNTASYTLTYDTDAGSTLVITSTVTTVTVGQGIPEGSVISIYNPPGNTSTTLARVSPTVMYLAGSTIDQNLTVAPGALVTLFFYETNKVVVSGSGVS